MGCVAWKKVPVTATLPVIVVLASETGWVAGKLETETDPETGWVVGQKVPVTATDEAKLTGCVVCQKVPVTATEELGDTAITTAGSVAMGAVLAGFTAAVLVPSQILVALKFDIASF